MNKGIILGICLIIGGFLGLTFWGQSSNIPPQPDNVVENQTDIIIHNETEVVDNNETEIIENNTEENEEFIHNFSQYTLLR